jgi:hypothetical protein
MWPTIAIRAMPKSASGISRGAGRGDSHNCGRGQPGRCLLVAGKQGFEPNMHLVAKAQASQWRSPIADAIVPPSRCEALLVAGSATLIGAARSVQLCRPSFWS